MNLAVFDIDGTLTRPYGGEDAAFLEALEIAFGFRDVGAEWDTYPHVTDTGLVTSVFESRYGRAPTGTEMTQFEDTYSRAFSSRASPEEGGEIPGAAAFLTAVRAAPDWSVAIATGNFRGMAELKLARGKIPWQGVPIATADDSVSRADLIRIATGRAREHYGIEAFSHVVSVGDAPWDLRTSRELQLPFVAVGARCGNPPNGRGMIPDYQDRKGALESLRTAVCW